MLTREEVERRLKYVECYERALGFGVRRNMRRQREALETAWWLAEMLEETLASELASEGQYYIPKEAHAWLEGQK